MILLFLYGYGGFGAGLSNIRTANGDSAECASLGSEVQEALGVGQGSQRKRRRSTYTAVKTRPAIRPRLDTEVSPAVATAASD